MDFALQGKRMRRSNRTRALLRIFRELTYIRDRSTTDRDELSKIAGRINKIVTRDMTYFSRAR